MAVKLELDARGVAIFLSLRSSCLESIEARGLKRIALKSECLSPVISKDGQ
jgi:hypothetical protein